MPDLETSVSDLPHEPYITAVFDVLDKAGLKPDEWWTSDPEPWWGLHVSLDAMISIMLPDAPWPFGLCLIWDWHVSSEGGGPSDGTRWMFAELNMDNSHKYPTYLPVHNYASPDAIVEATRKVISGEIGPGNFHNVGTPDWGGGTIGGAWERAEELDAACEAWSARWADDD